MPRKAKLAPIQPPVTPIAPQLPPAPEPPNPVVLALQEQILGLVNQRGVGQEHLTSANAALRTAQASAETARERLQMIEGEVRYRMGLINEMLGKPAQGIVSVDVNSIGGYGPRLDYSEGPTFSAPQAGVGSIPPRRAPMAGASDGVRTESAEEIRSML